MAICQENILLEQALHTSSPITYKSSITVVKQNLKKIYTIQNHILTAVRINGSVFCIEHLHRAITLLKSSVIQSQSKLWTLRIAHRNTLIMSIY